MAGGRHHKVCVSVLCVQSLACCVQGVRIVLGVYICCVCGYVHVVHVVGVVSFFLHNLYMRLGSLVVACC